MHNPFQSRFYAHVISRSSFASFPSGLGGGKTVGRALLFRLLRRLRLGEREALGLFAARGAFSYIVSALAVSHKSFTFAPSRTVPSDFTESSAWTLANRRPTATLCFLKETSPTRQSFPLAFPPGSNDPRP